MSNHITNQITFGSQTDTGLKAYQDYVEVYLLGRSPSEVGRFLTAHVLHLIGQSRAKTLKSCCKRPNQCDSNSCVQIRSRVFFGITDFFEGNRRFVVYSATRSLLSSSRSANALRKVNVLSCVLFFLDTRYAATLRENKSMMIQI